MLLNPSRKQKPLRHTRRNDKVSDALIRVENCKMEVAAMTPAVASKAVYKKPAAAPKTVTVVPSNDPVNHPLVTVIPIPSNIVDTVERSIVPP